MKYLFIILIVIGILFSNASHIPAWFFGAGKPTHPHWKLYGIFALIAWLAILVLAGTIF